LLKTISEINSEIKALVEIYQRVLIENYELAYKAEEYKIRAEVDSLRARYFRKVLKLHKINFVEHPTQEDLDNVLSEIELQKEAESNEDNEA
jgi:hypothetical protein